MAITKKLIHFNQFSNFNTQKLSANRENTAYTIGVGGAVTTGEPYILFHSIVFIKDVLKIWTHGSLYDCGETDLSDYLTADEIAEVYATIEALNGKQDKVTDLETIRSGAAKGATAVQPSSLANVATSGSYNDLSNKPTIPSAVTESTVSGWGFTKNTGTYSKPSGGIPKSDLVSTVQTSLGKADTALQSYTETDPVFKASAAAGITSANITSWNGKQDASLKFTNKAASTWVSDSTYADFPYRCDIACNGVTADMYAEVTFALSQAASGAYAPICETKANVVSIWSKANTSITVPTILITK